MRAEDGSEREPSCKNQPDRRTAAGAAAVAAATAFQNQLFNQMETLLRRLVKTALFSTF